MMELPQTTRCAAARLRRVTQAGMVLVVLAVAASAWVLGTGEARFGTAAIRIEAGDLPPSGAMIVLAATGLLLALALWRLAAMLRRIEQGFPFPAVELRGFAFYLFLAVLASILLPPLVQIGLSGGPVTFALEGGQALMLVVTGLLFLVARLLDQAQRIADDASQIV